MIPLFVVGSCLAVSVTARAQDADVAGAHQAYERGARAYDRGEYGSAATEFARADDLAPSVTALRFALKAVLKADDPVLAMSLVERAQKREVSLSELAREVKDKFGSRVGQILIRCAGDCSAMIDGKEARVGVRQFLAIGSHDVEIDTGDGTDRRTVTLSADRVVTVRPHVSEEPPDEERPAPRDSGRREQSHRGVSPTLFWGGVGGTVLLGAVTVASGLDTKSRHDEFKQSPTDDRLASEGRSAQTRTNVLLVGTALVAVATGVVGLFVVDW